MSHLLRMEILLAKTTDVSLHQWPACPLGSCFFCCSALLRCCIAAGELGLHAGAC